jgi:hypothetical protein
MRSSGRGARRRRCRGSDSPGGPPQPIGPLSPSGPATDLLRLSASVVLQLARPGRIDPAPPVLVSRSLGEPPVARCRAESHTPTLGGP